MGNPAYLITNLGESATITAETADTVYGVANSVDKILANPFRFTVTSGGWIEFDLGGSAAYDTVAILGHNHDPSATYNITSGGSPAPVTSRATPAWRKEGIWADVGSLTDRYLRIDVTDSNSKNTEIGQVVIGTRIELATAEWFFGGMRGRMESDVVHRTFGGVVRAFKLYGYEKREYRFVIPEASLPSYQALHNNAKGLAIPFVWIEDVADVNVWYVRKEPNFEPSEINEKSGPCPRFDYQLVLSEESHGLDVLA